MATGKKKRKRPARKAAKRKTAKRSTRRSKTPDRPPLDQSDDGQGTTTDEPIAELPAVDQAADDLGQAAAGEIGQAVEFGPSIGETVDAAVAIDQGPAQAPASPPTARVILAAKPTPTGRTFTITVQQVSHSGVWSDSELVEGYDDRALALVRALEIAGNWAAPFVHDQTGEPLPGNVGLDCFAATVLRAVHYDPIRAVHYDPIGDAKPAPEPAAKPEPAEPASGIRVATDVKQELPAGLADKLVRTLLTIRLSKTAETPDRVGYDVYVAGQVEGMPTPELFDTGSILVPSTGRPRWLSIVLHKLAQEYATGVLPAQLE